MKNILISLKSVLNLLYPNSCLVCQTIIEDEREGFCLKCSSKFEPTGLGNWVDKITHSDKIDRAFSGYYFNSEIQKVIHSLKYQERAKLGADLGSIFAKLIPFKEVEPIDLLLPVPLHPVKKRDRGYNQALWIAKGMSRVWDIPFKTDVLKRVKFTKSQTTLSIEEREENMRDAVKATKDLTGLHVGIVDDVLTTGSTISVCAGVCKNAGAETVTALTSCTPKINAEEL